LTNIFLIIANEKNEFLVKQIETIEQQVPFSVPENDNNNFTESKLPIESYEVNSTLVLIGGKYPKPELVS
jgi:hypothetical protein